MNEALDKTQFLTAVSTACSVRKKATLDAATLALWWRTLKEFPLHKVLAALDEHVKYSKHMPIPFDIVKRLNGVKDNGDANEPMPSDESRCTYTANSQRCPARVGYRTFGVPPLCLDHHQHRHDPAHSQRVLENLLQNGPAFEPRTPNRQRAEFLFETQGVAAVLAELGPDYVTWLRREEARGLVRELRMPMPSTPPGVRSRAPLSPDAMSATARTVAHHQQHEESFL